MRRSTSPPLSPSSTQPPPLSLPGLLSSCDKEGASTHTVPPARDGSSTGQPLPSVGGQTSLLEEKGNNLKEMKRENSETRLLDLEIAFTKMENYAQAMKNNNIQFKDPRVGEEVAELFDKMYQKLPPDLQEQVRAELDATIFQHAEEENEPPKIKRTRTKRLIGWTVENVVLPIGFGLLMFIISLYFNKAEETKGNPRC